LKKSATYKALHYAASSNLRLCHPSSVQYPQELALKYLQSVLLLMLRDQVSYPYKTTGKVIGMYILIFTFLDKQARRPKVLN
jgi:hypothetical protein